MARRKTLTDNMILKEKPEAKRRTMPDPEMRGHYIRITPKGAKSFVAVARNPGGKQVWATIGGCDVLTIAEAREKARDAIRRIKTGQPAFEPPPVMPDSLKHIAETWMLRHVFTTTSSQVRTRRTSARRWPKSGRRKPSRSGWTGSGIT